MSNRYEILEQIGKGGLGAVYKALDTQLQREVAIKRVLTADQATEEEVQEAAAKLMAEAQTLSSLNHPNIVTVFDVGQDESGGFVVMELLKGETLDETVERGVLTQEDFTEVVYQTMEALIAAQANNVIHRDIKPTNIMVIWQASGKFQLKILDFGLAKFSRAPSVQTMDQDESVMGSIFFMAPEQFERGELDARTDLYQMGCVYYNALTGQYPFNGDTAPQVMNAHLQHKVIPLDQVRPDLSPSICQWVMWMINRDIAHRPDDARDALKRWPRNPEPPGAVPVEVLPVEATPSVSTSEVTIVRAGGGATAPPALILSHQTGSAPVLVRTGGSTTGRLATGGATTGRLHTGPLASHTGGVRRNTRRDSAENSKTKWILFGSCAAVALLFLIFTTVRSNKAKAQKARIVSLASAEIPTGTTADVSLAVTLLGDADSSASLRDDAAKVLATLEGSGISEKVHEELKVAKTMALRIRLSHILAERHYTPAVPTIIDTFRSVGTDDQRVQLLDAVRALAGLDSIDEILGALRGDHTLPVRKVFEDTVLAVLRKTGDAAKTRGVVDSILTKVSTTSGNERKSLFRILGVLGGDDVKTRLAAIYSGEDNQEYQRDAMTAYLNWQNRSVLADVEKIIQTTEDVPLRSAAERAYVRLANLPGPEPLAERVPLWRKAFEYSRNPTDARRLIAALVERPAPETLALLKEWSAHATYGTLAKSSASTVEKTIPSIPELKPGDTLKGNKARVQGDNRAAINSSLSSLTSWVSPETWFLWNFKVAEEGRYFIEVDQAYLHETPSQFLIHLVGKTLRGESKTTPTLDKFVPVRLTEPVDLVPEQIYALVLTAGDHVQPRMMDIGAIRLVKE
ncbi:MAG: serine/threonine protein kinase [Verrucomicrobiaceae bacterium]|nr:serine/threonine protein kinase [Verrucomicrobiaceae bacterium]